MHPINILPRLKEVPEIVTVYCATANPVEIIFVDTVQGRAILGVVDGLKPKGIEIDNDIDERKKFLRNMGTSFEYIIVYPRSPQTPAVNNDKFFIFNALYLY